MSKQSKKGKSSTQNPIKQPPPGKVQGDYRPETGTTIPISQPPPADIEKAD